MSEGRVEQVGPPIEVYQRPSSLAVAAAIGSPGMNLLAATIASVDADVTTVRLVGGETVRTGAIVPADAVGAAVTLGIRPEHLHVDDAGPFVGAVELFERLGPLSFAHLGARGAADTIVAQLPGDRSVTLGEVLRVGVALENAHVFGVDGRAYPFTLPPSSPVR